MPTGLVACWISGSVPSWVCISASCLTLESASKFPVGLLSLHRVQHIERAFMAVHKVSAPAARVNRLVQYAEHSFRKCYSWRVMSRSAAAVKETPSIAVVRALGILDLV